MVWKDVYMQPVSRKKNLVLIAEDFQGEPKAWSKISVPFHQVTEHPVASDPPLPSTRHGAGERTDLRATPRSILTHWDPWDK